MDIEALQRQLKAAIQSHQVLVAKLKTEPQNSILQRQLRELQSQITVLSDKQRSYVQQLRKELVNTGSSALIVSKSDGSRAAGVQTIGMTPGVRYSLRPAPGGGMTLMPSGGISAPIPATISLAPVSAANVAGVASNGMHSFAVVNPSLQSPVPNVVTLRSPLRFNAVNSPNLAISGCGVSATALTPAAAAAAAAPAFSLVHPQSLTGAAAASSSSSSSSSSPSVQMAKCHPLVISASTLNPELTILLSPLN